MAFINDLDDRLSRLAISYGRHAVRGYLTKHIVELAGVEKQVTLQRALGKGPWDSNEATYYAGELIDPANIHFHQGLANDAPDAFFPSDIAHNNAAYESARLPAGFGDEDPPDRAIGIYKTLQVANYDGAGAQTGFAYSPSPARHITDLMLRAKRSIARVNYPAWVDWRDFCAELIDWDDGALTPHQIFLTLSNGGTLATDTYWIRVATLKGADISSASKDRSTSDPTVTASIAVDAPNSQFTVEWTSQAERGATGYRVYIGTAEGAEDRYFQVNDGATNTLLISTLAGATMGVPPEVATGALLRQIPRFETHLFFQPPFELATAFDRIAQVTCMDWQYANGKLVFLTPEIRGPVFTLNMAEIRDFRTYKTDRRQSFNQIIVNYRDLDSPYLEQADPPVTINRLSLQAKEGVRPFEINLGGGYRSQAERVGNYWARRLIDSNQIMEGIGSPKTYIVLPGDVVNVTHDVPGWEDESFYIEEKEEEEDSKAGYPLKGRVYGAWYSDTDSNPLPSPLPAPNPSTFVAPPQVTSVTLSQINTLQPDQTFESSIRVEVQFAAYVNRQRGRVYIKKSTEADALYKDVGTITPDPRFSWALPTDYNEGITDTLLGSMEIRGRAKAIYNVKVVPESGLLSAGIAGATMYPITITGKAAALASNTEFWVFDLGFGRRNRMSWDLPIDYGEGVTFEVWATLTGATFLGDPLIGYPGNELYSGGTPSNLLYHGRLNEFFLSQDSPFALQPLWIRSVDSSGNKSLWTRSDLFYVFNAFAGSIPAGPTLTVDAGTSTALGVVVHLATSLKPGDVTATRVQIRQQGGSWPSTTNGTDRQFVFDGLHREVVIPWFNGGIVEIRAMFDASPSTNWSSALTHSMITTGLTQWINNGAGIHYLSSVGVGTSTPATYVHIKGNNIFNRGQLTIEATDFTQISMWSGVVGMKSHWYHDISNNVSYLGTSSAGGQLRLITGADVNAVHIDAIGNVGVAASAYSGSGFGPVSAVPFFVRRDQSTTDTSIVVQNAATTGGVTGAAFRSVSDGAHLQVASWGSSHTGTRFGTTINGWCEMISITGNGIIYGSFNNVPVIFGQNASGRMTFDTSGNVTAHPSGHFIFDPFGKYVRPNVNYDLNLGAVDKKWLTIHGAELRVETLVAHETMATFGGRAIFATCTLLIADLAPGGTTLDVKHNNLASSNVIYLETVGQVEWMQVTSGATSITGGYRYSVTRNLDGSGANQWYAGDSVATTNSFIDVYSVRGMKSAAHIGPTIVGHVRNSVLYNDFNEHWAIGNLQGLYGYGSATFGVGFGRYDGLSTFITIDNLNGYRTFGPGPVVIQQIDNSGNIRVGELGVGKANTFISAGSFSVRLNTTNLFHIDTSGNVTLGTVAANQGNAYWNNTTKTLQFRGGAGGTVVQAYVDTTGLIVAGGGNVLMGSSGLKVFGGNFSVQNTGLTGNMVFDTANASGGIVQHTQNLDTGGSGQDGRLVYKAMSGEDLAYTGFTLASGPFGAGSFRFWGESGIAGLTIGANATPGAMLDVRGSAVFSGTLGLGTAPVSGAMITGLFSDSGSKYALDFKNTNSGGITSLCMRTDTGSVFEMGVRNSARAAYGILIALDAYVYSYGDFTYMADGGGSHKFASGGNALRLKIDSLGNIVPGTAALTTGAVSGFTYVQSCAGAPTGTPTIHTGRAPQVVDTTNGRAYWYYGGAWHYAALT